MRYAGETVSDRRDGMAGFGNRKHNIVSERSHEITRVDVPNVPVGGVTKRLFDIILAFVAITCLLPLFLGCCVLVFSASRGGILFRHRRIGFRGEEFECLKFRTMVADAERALLEHLATNPEARNEWESNHKLRKDPRITPLGDFLRRSSLDELPQLFNVVKGEMSIVGPRPIVSDEIKKYHEHFDQYAIARPGITGLWQISGRSSTSYAERVAYDVDYVRNWSLTRDVRIIMGTFGRVIGGSDAY